MPQGGRRSRRLLHALFLHTLLSKLFLRHDRAHWRHEVHGWARWLLALFEHTALKDTYGKCGPSHTCTQLTDLSHHPHALQHRTEDDMVTVKISLRRQRNHEDGAVGILPPIHHGQVTVSQELHVKIFIGEALAVDADTMALASACEHVTSDNGGAWLDQVDHCVAVAQGLVLHLVALAELQEVLAGQWDLLAVEANHDSARILVPDANVHED